MHYEASDDLRDGILNNWLVNITGELGKWIEADLLQEHYNRWLEDMVKKRGGDFDDNFYRHTLSPNVDHFLRIKEEIENAFTLRSRGKTHTSPHLRDELRVLLALYKEENLHHFCTGRTLGHAATNQFNKGYKRLDTTKLDDFITSSTAYADVIADIQVHRQAEGGPEAYSELQAQSPPQPDSENTTLAGTSETSSSCASERSSVHLTPSHGIVSSRAQYEDGDLNDDEDDPSNNQLVSGSDYDIYLSDDKLMHDTWHKQNEDYGEDVDNSSDDEDDDSLNIFFSDSDGNNSAEENDLYNSD